MEREFALALVFLSVLKLCCLVWGGGKSEPIYIVFQGKCTYCSQGEKLGFVGRRQSKPVLETHKKKRICIGVKY